MGRKEAREIALHLIFELSFKKFDDAELLSARLEQEDAAIRYYSGMKQLFDEAAGLRNVLAGYEESGAVAAESAALAESGFKAGEISLAEHLVGLGLYYNIVDSTLEAERDYHLAIARLESYKL